MAQALGKEIVDTRNRLINGHKVSFRGSKKISKLGISDGCTALKILETIKLYILNFLVNCKDNSVDKMVALHTRA